MKFIHKLLRILSRSYFYVDSETRKQNTIYVADFKSEKQDKKINYTHYNIAYTLSSENWRSKNFISCVQVSNKPCTMIVLSTFGTF